MSTSTSTGKFAKSPRSHKTPRSTKTAKGTEAPPVQEDVRGRNLKRVGVAGAALIVAGGAAFGIDQVFSSSPSVPAVKGSGGAPSALPGARANIYLGTAPNAVVELDLIKAAKGGYTGSATVLAQLGSSTSRSDAFVGYPLSASLTGNHLQVHFSGGPESRATVRNGSFSVTVPIPYASPQLMEFHLSNPQAVSTAQSAFKAKLASNPGS